MDPRLTVVLLLLLNLAFLSPILVSVFLAVFRGRGVSGRWLFVLVGPVAAYTVLWVATLVFIAPAWLILTFFTPAVKELTNHTPYWYPFASWLASNDWWLAGVVCALLAAWLVLHLWPRWPAILAALVSSPKRESP